MIRVVNSKKNSLERKEATAVASIFVNTGEVEMKRAKEILDIFQNKFYDVYSQKKFLRILNVCMLQLPVENFSMPNGYQNDYTAVYYEIEQRLLILSKNEKEQSSDSFTKEEIGIVNEKIDEIIEMIKRNGYGQEVLFNELQELKSQVHLGRKTWKQLVIGKITEGVLSNTIDKTIGNAIFVSLLETKDEFFNRIGNH